MSTSYSCSGDPTPDDDVTDCYLTFFLYGYRHIKQVKIGETCRTRTHYWHLLWVRCCIFS